VTAADPPPEAALTPVPRAPQPRTTERWPGGLPLVWAPRAHTVEVLLPRADPPERRAMRLVGAHEPGYWRASDHLPAGTDYAFSIDGGPALPDPCSTLLPEGIHGPSRVLDEDFTWHDDAWRGVDLTHGVLLHLDVATATAAGTLDAAAELLPAVASLGVDGVELAPIAAFDPSTGPEAGVRLFAVHGPWGGPAALHRFVDAAHRHGLAVVLEPPHRWAVADALGLHAFGPYASGARLGPRAGAGSRQDAPRINLDGSGSRGARDFLVADARRWLADFHVDGLLLDVEALVDRSAVPFLGELAEVVQSVADRSGRPRTLLTDGPGRSDRLTTVVGRILTEDDAQGPMDELLEIAAEAFPAGTVGSRAPTTSRRAHRAAARSAPVLVGDLTRLPAAVPATTWSGTSAGFAVSRPDPPTDVDARAALLAFAVLAGTPLVLDTQHVPVARRDAPAERLVHWTRRLLSLRPSSLADLARPVEPSVGTGVLVVRRGDTALVLATAHEGIEVDLAQHLTEPVGSWRVAAPWRPEATRLLAGRRLRLPGRSVVVLRRDDGVVGEQE
jgi:maltooligosyltrehalose trehalohydrolase